MENTTQGRTVSGDRSRELFEDSLLLLASVRETVAELLNEVRLGNPKTVPALMAEAATLQKALKSAIELEKGIHDWNGRHGGGGSTGEIDMDRARDEIRCRLARLRACCHSA